MLKKLWLIMKKRLSGKNKNKPAVMLMDPPKPLTENEMIIQMVRCFFYHLWFYGTQASPSPDNKRSFENLIEKGEIPTPILPLRKFRIYTHSISENFVSHKKLFADITIEVTVGSAEDEPLVRFASNGGFNLGPSKN